MKSKSTDPSPQRIANIVNGNSSAHIPIRFTLTKVFSWLGILIFVLFVSVTLLSFFRLVKFQQILSDINERSIPSVVTSSHIYTQVNTLTFLTEGLALAESEAARRIAYEQVENKIEEIKGLAQHGEENPYMYVQIDAIKSEFAELNHLVSQRLDVEVNLREQGQALFDLHANTLQFVESDAQVAKRMNYAWIVNFSELVTLASRLPTLNRLHLIRQQSALLQVKYDELVEQGEAIDRSLHNQRDAYQEELKELLFSEKGLVNLSLNELRIHGRTAGRGNFVKNLINDFARMAEYRSAQITKGVVENSERNASHVKQQTRIIGGLALISGAVLIIVGVFIQRRIVSRLSKLNQLVQKRMKGQTTRLHITGDDEISDIAQSFQHFAETIEEQKQALHQLSLSDGLTGISNRRAFDERLKHEIVTAERQCWSLSLLMMDVDFFKQYNDNYGHNAGDACLQNIAQALNNKLHRKGDFVARYGGEEFVCILPDTTHKGAQRVATVLLETIAELNIPHKYSGAADHITISIGIASTEPQLPVDSQILIEHADQALYMAKKSGRNKWHYYKAIPNSRSGTVSI